MEILRLIFLGMLVPSAICGFMTGAIAYLWLLEDEPDDFANWWFVTGSVGIGYMAGYVGVEGLPPLVPEAGLDWLLFSVGFGMIMRFLERLSALNILLVKVGFSIAGTCYVMSATFQTLWEPTEGVIWLAIIACGFFICWEGVEASFKALPSGMSSPFLFFSLSVAGALIFAVSGSVQLAKHFCVFAALFATLWGIAGRLLKYAAPDADAEKFRFPPPAAAVIVPPLGILWVHSYFHAAVPGASLLLVAISPFLTLVGKIGAIQRLGPQRCKVIQLSSALLPVVIAVAIAVARS